MHSDDATGRSDSGARGERRVLGVTADGGGRRWTRVVPAGYSLGLALVVVGPLLGSGYLLLRDAVSTPRSYLTDAALGVGDAAPRAVPQDALVATVSAVLDGGVVVKAILVGALWLAGWGAAVLARELMRASVGPQLVASTVAVWNPYVGERLSQGHWSLLTGYAALPWIALLANRLRGGGSKDTAASDRSHRLRTWVLLAGVMAAAGLTPTGSLLAGLTALPLVGRRNLLATVGLWVATAAPWLMATALSGAGGDPSDPAGVAAFAARAEPGLGTLGSLAGLGGIWNSTAVPGSRTTFFAVMGTLILLAVVATGVRRVAAEGTPSDTHQVAAEVAAESRGARQEAVEPTAESRHTRRILLTLAVIAIVLPALGATGWGLTTGEFLVSHIPGVGLLRDTQKYVALAMPAFALCAAAGTRFVAEKISGTAVPSLPPNAAAPSTPTDAVVPLPRQDRAPYIAAVFIALLIAALPDLAWGVGGELRPVHYPAAWDRVAALVDAPGDVAVLPGGMFRKFRYSGSAPVLDPAPRMLPRDVLQTGELPVHGATVNGEGARAREVEQILLRGGSPADLARLGLGWVLLEGGTPGPLGDSKTTLAQLHPAYTDASLQLYRVPGPITSHDASPTSRRWAGAAHLLWAALLVAGALASISPSRCRLRTKPAATQTNPTFDS